MPGKRLSAIFSDLDFSFLGCGNPVSSPEDEKYLKQCNAPVKRLKQSYTSKLRKSSEEVTESRSIVAPSIRERPLSREELLFDLELLQTDLNNLDVESSSLMDDIVNELRLLHPNNTLLKKAISMPALCMSEETYSSTTISITKSLSIANARTVENTTERTR